MQRLLLYNQINNGLPDRTKISLSNRLIKSWADQWHCEAGEKEGLPGVWSRCLSMTFLTILVTNSLTRLQSIMELKRLMH